MQLRRYSPRSTKPLLVPLDSSSSSSSSSADKPSRPDDNDQPSDSAHNWIERVHVHMFHCSVTPFFPNLLAFARLYADETFATEATGQRLTSERPRFVIASVVGLE